MHDLLGLDSVQLLDLFSHSTGLLDGGSARRRATTCKQDNTNRHPQVGLEPMIPEFQWAASHSYYFLNNCH
jgi:hypothetical protein